MGRTPPVNPVIRIGRPEIGLNGRRVTSCLMINNHSYDWWYEIEDVSIPIVDQADVFLPGAYLAALWAGADLHVEGACSDELIKKLEGPIAGVWKRWFPERIRPVAIEAAEKLSAMRPPGERVGCFFSGGVDSLYTAINRSVSAGSHDPITDLVTVHGFDVPIKDTLFFEKVAESNRRTAERLGMRFIGVRTNIREWSDLYCPWEFFHGAAMAGVGYLLSGGIRMMWIPSGTGTQNRWGTHPELDSHWGSGPISFKHDVVGVQRLDKIRRVAEDPSALASMRVCWENKNSSYNCSSCEKCLRTMVSLYVLGLAQKTPMFQWNRMIQSIFCLRIPAHLRHHWKAAEKNLAEVHAGFFMRWAVRWALMRSVLNERLRGAA